MKYLNNLLNIIKKFFIFVHKFDLENYSVSLNKTHLQLLTTALYYSFSRLPDTQDAKFTHRDRRPVPRPLGKRP